MKRIIALFLSIIIAVMILASCKKNNSDSSTTANGEITTTSLSDVTSGADESSPSDSTENTESLNTTTAPTGAVTTKPTTNPPVGSKTLNVKDYGAVGDGKTDDGNAIFAAVSALQSNGKGSTLVFESNKTYYVKRSPTSAVFILNGASDITLKGNNTTILIEAPKFYADFQNTSNVTVEGFNFDYKTKPAFNAKTINIDNSKKEAIMTADRDIGLENGETYIPTVPGGGGWFGVLDRPDGRYHMYIKSYTMIDKAAKKFKVTFGNDGTTSSRISQLSTTRFIAPMPYVGHTVERAFSLDANTNLTMKNCNVHAVSRFSIALFNSEGTIRFTNFNFVRANNSLDKNLNFTAWRDGYHCKENRAKIIWDNCKAESLYDDVINISASTLYVKEVNSAKNEINMYWPETSSTYSSLKKGDKLTIINTQSGELIGKTTVDRVMSQSGSTNRIKLSSALPSLTTGAHILVFFDSMAAPGSEIKNSNFDGTFRFRGPLTVTNTKIHNRRMWIDLYGDTEGPLPQDIIFKNSPITLDSKNEQYFHISSYNSKNSSNAYHIKNIVFENCGVSRSNMEIGPKDEVTIR